MNRNTMFRRILIANRGEIAVRIMRTVKQMGIESVGIYSEADEMAPHVRMATQAYGIGPAPVKESYLQAEKIIELAREKEVDAIHPGYGLLSESRSFAQQCEEAGIAFIGPTPEQIKQFGLKHEARRLAKEQNVPLVPGSELLEDEESAIQAAESIGYPVMLKATAGGGGIGMEVCEDASALRRAYDKVKRLGDTHFGQADCFVEKYIPRARHLEVQIFGDGSGRVVSMGVRDCSAQRRNQKVIEETPPPHISEQQIASLEKAARDLARAVYYRSAGTVEFIYDEDEKHFYFLEMNTRLQVEHGVTEAVTGIDLVEWMIRQAAGEYPLSQHNENRLPREGHAIQARIYAEDPRHDFMPCSGTLTHVAFPDHARCDHWIEAGSEVPTFYDPLLAKVIVHEQDRASAVQSLANALDQTKLYGLETNLAYLRSILKTDVFDAGRMTTRYLSAHEYHPPTCEVLRSGTMTTIQDEPGRIGYWHVGVPPSGPMDALSFNCGNQLLNNPADSAGMEITANGPRLQFYTACKAVLTGCDIEAGLDGTPIPSYEVFTIPRGGILDIGKARGRGIRAYLNVEEGFDVPDYLGSKSTFTLGKFGGHGGRALQTGDVLYLNTDAASASEAASLHLDEARRPQLAHEWSIGVTYGPHGAPDFFTDAYIKTFLDARWEVHYNSSRTGVRLIGPKPGWAREDGGEAGLHPSNIHDNAYGVGAIDFTGDMPVILGPDGPSLGGFVCPFTITKEDLWKIGQFRPGDTLTFYCIDPTEHDTLNSEAAHTDTLSDFSQKRIYQSRTPPPNECILHEQGEGFSKWVIRRSGDHCILIEAGPMQLDLRLRAKIHVLHEKLRTSAKDEILEYTPGIRSIQLHFDPQRVHAKDLVDWVATQIEQLPDWKNMELPSRRIYLPISWDDPSTQEAIQKYMRSVRPDAPWCPDNIEFIRRINGLSSREAVKNILFEATYVVLGLGDVYLGAPVATPLDPRHRLVTTKYNPARTWTPENAVGIGGAYLCIYGMEGPGGYQFVGRTLQMWNRYHCTDYFQQGKPWLLRFFDQVRFFPVSSTELQSIRKHFLHGNYELHVEPCTFKLQEHEAFLEAHAESIQQFKKNQTDAFEMERRRWEEAGLDAETDEPDSIGITEEEPLPEEALAVESPVSGSVWKWLQPTEGTYVEKGTPLAILESMKMEVTVEAPEFGYTTACLANEGEAVRQGQTLQGILPNAPTMPGKSNDT